jgi:hypothetical protein
MSVLTNYFIGAPTRTRTWKKGLEDPCDIHFTIEAMCLALPGTTQAI